MNSIRWFAMLLTAAGAIAAGVTYAGSQSEGVFVFLRPDESSFWHTARTDTLSVPVWFPADAASAELTVTAVGYAKKYDISRPADEPYAEISVILPAAESVDTENVYALKLEFNDGTVRETRLGKVYGVGGNLAAARYLSPSGNVLWRKTGAKAVVPVPCGADEVVVDGEPVSTGLGGAAGWFVLEADEPGVDFTVSLETPAQEYEAVLKRKRMSPVMTVK